MFERSAYGTAQYSGDTSARCTVDAITPSDEEAAIESKVQVGREIIILSKAALVVEIARGRAGFIRASSREHAFADGLAVPLSLASLVQRRRRTVPSQSCAFVFGGGWSAPRVPLAKADVR